jgi:heptaprenyl diphosphate synthase
MLYSLAGGILSLIVMLMLCRIPKVGAIGVSACGAVSHNIGQLIVASAMLGVGTVWAYLPILMLSGVIMGPITGYIAQTVFASLKRSGTEFRITPKSLKESKVLDITLIACILVIAGAVWAEMSFNGLDRSSADKAIEQAAVPTCYVEVSQNTDVKYIIPLSEYGSYKIVNNYTDGYDIFVIDEDGVHMSEASCPDHICISEGTIGPEEIIPICCLPNLLVLQVITEDEMPEDFDMDAQDWSAILLPN